MPTCDCLFSFLRNTRIQPDAVIIQEPRAALNNKLIFMASPKVATRSVKETIRKVVHLEPIENPQDLEKFWDSAFKFTWTRDPWDKLVSAYIHIHHGSQDKDDFKDFVKNRMINEEGIMINRHWGCQWHNAYCKCGTKYADFVGKIETFDTDWPVFKKELLDRVGLDVPDAPIHINKGHGDKSKYRSFYDAETKAIADEIFKKDIELFGYDQWEVQD